MSKKTKKAGIRVRHIPMSLKRWKSHETFARELIDNLAEMFKLDKKDCFLWHFASDIEDELTDAWDSGYSYGVRYPKKREEMRRREEAGSRRQVMALFKLKDHSRVGWSVINPDGYWLPHRFERVSYSFDWYDWKKCGFCSPWLCKLLNALFGRSN